MPQQLYLFNDRRGYLKIATLNGIAVRPTQSGYEIVLKFRHTRSRKVFREYLVANDARDIEKVITNKLNEKLAPDSEL